MHFVRVTVTPLVRSQEAGGFLRNSGTRNALVRVGSRKVDDGDAPVDTGGIARPNREGRSGPDG